MVNYLFVVYYVITAMKIILALKLIISFEKTLLISYWLVKRDSENIILLCKPKGLLKKYGH